MYSSNASPEFQTIHSTSSFEYLTGRSKSIIESTPFKKILHVSKWYFPFVLFLRLKPWSQSWLLIFCPYISFISQCHWLHFQNIFQIQSLLTTFNWCHPSPRCHQVLPRDGLLTGLHFWPSKGQHQKDQEQNLLSKQTLIMSFPYSQPSNGLLSQKKP